MAPSRLLTLLLQVPGCQQSVKITFGFYPGLVELGYHSKQQHTGHRAGFLSEQQYIEYNWSQISGEICKHQTALPCLFCSTQHYMKVMRYRGTDFCLGLIQYDIRSVQAFSVLRNRAFAFKVLSYILSVTFKNVVNTILLQCVY